jgi:hypothetical protein
MKASRVEEGETKPVYSKTKEQAIRVRRTRMAFAEGGSMKIHKENNRLPGRLRSG